jgi:trans-2,3-dihydro-3-hydroxyanthranilate isomerase
MKKISIYQIDAFTKKPFGGNPAAVTKSNDLTVKEMQLIAAEMNLSETAFLSSSDKADFRLRWFTPKKEVNLCGHATIAALHFLKETGELSNDSEVRFETSSGILQCFIKDQCYLMQIPKMKFKEYPDRKDKILSFLNITGKETEGDFILLENGYLYIYIKTLKRLEKIIPDYAGINSLSVYGIKAVAAYSLETMESESSAHLRFFDPYDGLTEDPVTGSANGPLLHILTETGKLNANEVQFEQGDFVGRPGRVKVMYKDNDIYIAGNAVTVLKGEICL